MKELTDRHFTAIDLLLRGVMKKEVAAQLGVIPSTVSAWMKDELFRDELEDRREKVREIGAKKLESLIPKALFRLEQELERTGSPAVRSAVEVLRMCGFYVDKVHVTSELAIQNMELEELENVRNKIEEEIQGRIARLTDEELSEHLNYVVRKINKRIEEDEKDFKELSASVIDDAKEYMAKIDGKEAVNGKVD